MGSWYLERTEFQTEMMDVGEMTGHDGGTSGMDFTSRPLFRELIKVIEMVHFMFAHFILIFKTMVKRYIN